MMDKIETSKQGGLYANPFADACIMGLDIPFPMQVVLNTSVLRLGVMLEVNGPPAACKTMLMYEMGRWFKNVGGLLHMVLTEAKVSETLGPSLIGYDIASRAALTVRPAENMELMQRYVQDA